MDLGVAYDEAHALSCAFNDFRGVYRTMIKRHCFDDKIWLTKDIKRILRACDIVIASTTPETVVTMRHHVNMFFMDEKKHRANFNILRKDGSFPGPTPHLAYKCSSFFCMTYMPIPKIYFTAFEKLCLETSKWKTGFY
jgi:hypothetical protein